MSLHHAPLVLIADDNVDAREIYGLYLGTVGYRVETAMDGHEAVVKARALHPDVVVLDLHMPRIDGWGALKVLRDDPNTAAIPVVVLTCDDFKSFPKPAARTAGAVSYLMKPCLPEWLANEIAERLRLPRTGMATASGM
jgi:two-component system cell cycle response regulator DivK